MGSNAYYYNGHKGLKKFIRLVVWWEKNSLI
jgi:hypothetical protein